MDKLHAINHRYISFLKNKIKFWNFLKTDNYLMLSRVSLKSFKFVSSLYFHLSTYNAF